jgi:hypothetical protein
MAAISCGRAVYDAALSVDGLVVRLRRFRKSHHLIGAGSGPRGIAVGSVMSARVGLLRAYHTVSEIR